MRRNRIWLCTAFVACFFAAGLPFWTIPYQQVNLPDSLEGHPMVAVALAAFLLCMFRLAKPWQALLASAGAMPAAVMVRIQVETQRDPTSHNLWPFEFFIAAGLGIACACPGVLVGRLSARLLRSPVQEEPQS